jgi:hypothetical protein
MAKCTVLCWQEIPSLVDAREGRASHKVQLSERFQELIDAVAMRRGLAGTDDYLAAWNKLPPEERDGTPQEAAEALAHEIESRFEEIKAKALGR